MCMSSSYFSSITSLHWHKIVPLCLKSLATPLVVQRLVQANIMAFVTEFTHRWEVGSRYKWPGARPTKHISMKIQNALISSILDRSQRYFAHVTTVTLSWRVQNIVVIGRVYFTLECFEFSSNFEFDRNMLSGTGASNAEVNVFPCHDIMLLFHLYLSQTVFWNLSSVSKWL